MCAVPLPRGKVRFLEERTLCTIQDCELVSLAGLA